jgi:hypothetical protein
MLSDLVMTKTEGEKLFHIFSKRFLQKHTVSGLRKMDEDGWNDYLDSIEGVQHIRKFSEYYSDPVEHLLEFINLNPGEKFVIRDPCNRDFFILIEKELAQKILVLGVLP